MSNALKHNPKSFKLRFAQSELFLKNNLIDEALACLEEGLNFRDGASKPDIIETKTRLAKIYFAKRDLVQAKKYTQQVLNQKGKLARGIEQ